MTPDEALEEAQAVTVAFQVALARIGVETIAEAIALFRRLRPEDLEGTAGGWLDDAILLVRSRRSQSQDLALAYFRLFRALRTGTTIPDPRNPEPAFVTLEDLREEFDSLLEDDDRIELDEELHEPEPILRPGHYQDANGDDHDAEVPDDGDLELPDEIPDEIPIEVDWAEPVEGDADGDPIENLIEELERQDEYSEQIIEDLLTDVVLKNYENALEKAERLDKRNREDLAERSREKGRSAAETTSAGYAQLVSNNAARGALGWISSRDRRVIGYARISRTGTPCAFCAMLISRGPVYKTASTAIKSDGDDYHPNCQCYAMPVMSTADFERMSVFDQSRELQREWYEGPSEEDWEGAEKTSNPALTAWRRYWRRKMRELEREQERLAA